MIDLKRFSSKEWSSNMWESPINAIYEAQQNALEGAMLSTVMRVGIDVNKEELTKALAYNRRQYEKGYADAKAEIVRCENCKHYKKSEVSDRMMCWRKDVDGQPVCYDFNPNDFCSYGKRRTDEND